jgi:hypothetical protein
MLLLDPLSTQIPTTRHPGGRPKVNPTTNANSTTLTGGNGDNEEENHGHVHDRDCRGNKKDKDEIEENDDDFVSLPPQRQSSSTSESAKLLEDWQPRSRRDRFRLSLWWLPVPVNLLQRRHDRLVTVLIFSVCCEWCWLPKKQHLFLVVAPFC